MTADRNGLQISSTGAGRSRVRLWQLGGCLLILACLVCSGVIVAVGFASLNLGIDDQAISTLETSLVSTSLPPLATMPAATEIVTTELPATDAAQNATVEPTATNVETLELDLPVPQEIEQRPVDQMAHDSLQLMLDIDYPPRDYFESAQRLSNSDLGKRTVGADTPTLGDTKTFFSDDGQVLAELLAITEHVYFWAEESLNYSQTEMARYAQRFEEDYLPQVQFLFGQEWRPGIDNDPRFSVLHLDGLSNDGELGFFDSGDEYPVSVNSVSNQQEMVYLNMRSLELGEDLYFGTLVHEVEHLFLWNSDPNEPVWMSEGLAQLTELYLGFDTVDTAADYLANTDTRLDDWEYEQEDSILAHYGAAYLFTVYLWEQFGDQAIIELAKNPANGLNAVQDLLRSYRPNQQLTEFLGDWSVANYLDGESDTFGHHYELLELGRPSHKIEVKTPPFQTTSKINQFGVHYALLDISGEFTLSFAGDSRQYFTGEPVSGSFIWYTPGQDEVDATLTGSFDLSGLSEATLSFWTWYDLEEDFDFAYVSVSTDDGSTWQLLTPEHARAGEFGPALTGMSEAQSDNVRGWVQESIAINRFAGTSILVRFEVVTDSAVTGSGFALDDIAIPELAVKSDVENGTDDWQANGFTRATSYAPQLWALRLIDLGEMKVTTLPLTTLSRGQWQFDLSPDGGVLVVMAQTPFVRNPASYWLAIED